MSLPKPDLHVRLCPEAKAQLGMLAEVDQVPEATLAARILEEAILGKAFALKLALRSLRRAGFSGTGGEP